MGYFLLLCLCKKLKNNEKMFQLIQGLDLLKEEWWVVVNWKTVVKTPIVKILSLNEAKRYAQSAYVKHLSL